MEDAHEASDINHSNRRPSQVRMVFLAVENYILMCTEKDNKRYTSKPTYESHIRLRRLQNY